jgi:hypothetical protein
MTMMLVCGSVLVGSFRECREKFKFSAFVAALHVALRSVKAPPLITVATSGFLWLVRFSYAI